MTLHCCEKDNARTNKSVLIVSVATYRLLQKCSNSQYIVNAGDWDSTLSVVTMFGEGFEAHAGVRSAAAKARLTLVRSPRKRALTTSTVDRIPSTPHNDKPAAIRPFEPRIATLRRSYSILTACLATNDRLSAWREAFGRASHSTIFQIGRASCRERV